MSNVETTHEQNVRRISRLSGVLFAISDVLLVSLLSFGYVLPFLLDLPDVSLVRAVSAVTLVLLVGFAQVLLLPVIAILFGYETLE